MIKHTDVTDDLLGFTIRMMEDDEMYLDGVIAEVLNHPDAIKLIREHYPQEGSHEET